MSGAFVELKAEHERLTAELNHARAEARAMHSAYETSVKVGAGLRALLERAGQRLTSLAKQSRCRCQSTAGYTHHCEACRALKSAEDITVMLRGDAPARAADETTPERCLKSDDGQHWERVRLLESGEKRTCVECGAPIK